MVGLNCLNGFKLVFRKNNIKHIISFEKKFELLNLILLLLGQRLGLVFIMSFVIKLNSFKQIFFYEIEGISRCSFS